MAMAAKLSTEASQQSGQIMSHGSKPNYKDTSGAEVLQGMAA